jgi:benzoyl-CoA reductase/2-hydroxyglutaryl-CoA dehydratase subunit BcrC/BadD/HgdB
VDLVPDESDLFLLEVPNNKESEDSINSWYLSINKLIKKLESVSGKKLKKKNLKEAILKVQKAREEYRNFHDLITTYPVIYGSLANIVLNSYFIDDVESWTSAIIKLNDELETLAKNKKFIANSNIRIMLSGAPSIFPNIKIPILIEKYGALLVSDDFCSTNRMLNDAVAVDEWNLYDMIPAVADRYLAPCSCPNFIRNNDRARILIDKVRALNIDGVIYQSLSGCYLHDIEYIKIKNQFEENNIPLLYFETDYSKDDLGQLTTRIEAFFESIKTRK